MDAGSAFLEVKQYMLCLKASSESYATRIELKENITKHYEGILFDKYFKTFSLLEKNYRLKLTK